MYTVQFDDLFPGKSNPRQKSHHMIHLRLADMVLGLFLS